MGLHKKTPEMIALEHERDVALARVKQVEDALALLREVQAKQIKAARAVDKVRARVATTPTSSTTRVNGSTHRVAAKGYHTNAVKLRRRKATAAKLAKFDRETPRSASEARIFGEVATLVRHGYLKSSGDGYVRTEKPFNVTAG